MRTAQPSLLMEIRTCCPDGGHGSGVPQECQLNLLGGKVLFRSLSFRSGA